MSIPIEKTLDDVRADMFSRIEAVQAEYQAKGYMPSLLNLNKGIYRGLIELWCWGLYQLYAFLIVILAMAFPTSAEKLWLELHCKQVGVSRKLKTKAAGTVYLLRDDTTGNLPVPAGRIIKTKPDGAGNVYRYVTMEEVVVPDGIGEVAVKVRAENAGVGYNATVGQISEIVTFIEGIDGVENRSGWLESEGTDDETDEALFARYQLKWQEGAGYTKYAYKSWAMGVSGVQEVAILDQHPRGQGTVDIIVRGAAGVPTQQVLDEVDDVIEDHRHQNDDAEVRGVTPVLVAIDGQGFEYKPGYIKEEVLAAAELKIRALFDPTKNEEGVTPFTIGEDLDLDRLTAAAMLAPGMKSTPWTSPADDIAVDDDGLLTLDSIILDATEAAEN